MSGSSRQQDHPVADIVEKFASLGAIPRALGPKEFAAYLASEDARWAPSSKLRASESDKAGARVSTATFGRETVGFSAGFAPLNPCASTPSAAHSKRQTGAGETQ
jgi:hypothetical protein